MPAQNFDFTRNDCGGIPCEQGASFYYELIWEKENPPDSGTYEAVDLTGVSAKMQVRKDANSPVIIELSTVNSKITIDPTNGKIILNISAAETNLLVPGMYKYDLELTLSSGFVVRFIQGKFEIVGQITV